MRPFKTLVFSIALIFCCLQHKDRAYADTDQAPFCASRFKIVFFGDSIVLGWGDDPGRYGYVERLARSLGQIEVRAIGFPGATSAELLAVLNAQIAPERSAHIWNTLEHADLVIVSAGINDYWENFSASTTVENLRRISLLLSSRLHSRSGAVSLIQQTTLPPTKNVDQRKWESNVNRILIAAPLFGLARPIRIESLPLSLLSNDGVHPMAEGYDWLHQKMETALGNSIPKVTLEMPHTATFCDSSSLQCPFLQRLTPRPKVSRHAQVYGRLAKKNVPQ